MNVMNHLRQWARYFIPADIAANENSLPYQKAFFLFLTLVITATASLLSCLAFSLLGNAILVALTASASLLGIVGLAVWHRTKKVFMPVNIVIAGLMVMNVIAIVLTGGLYSLLVFNFVVPQVLALVYYGPRRMMQLFVVWTLIIIGFIVLEVIGKTPSPIFLITSNGLMYGGITLTLLYGIFGAFYIADAIRQQAYAELQEERDTVKIRIEEATRHLEEQQESITIINNHLEERNTELQKAIQIAEAAEQLQADFLLNASHEVRTPLAVIIGFGEILADQVEGENTAAHESLHHIAEAGQNLLDIFNNILTLSTLGSNGLNLTPMRVELRGFVEQIAQEFASKAHAKGLSLICISRGSSGVGAKEWVHVDILYLRQILHHLLSNAIKFTQRGTVSLTAEVIVGNDMAASDILRWTVQDTGVGIAPEFRDKLFVSFYQHDAGQTRLYGGLGLGLAITKRLVEAMQGRIWCESELGKGSTFIVELPAEWHT